MKFFKTIGSGLKRVGAAVGTLWRRCTVGLSNARRWLFRSRIADYPVFVLDSEIEERSPQTPWWYSFIPERKAPMTLEYLSEALSKIAGDPATKGAVFIVKSPNLSMAQAQSLAALFQRFRERATQYGHGPKQVHIYLEQMSVSSYRLACGADKIYLTPLSEWNVLGLRVEPTYLKETLNRVGITYDLVKIAPWKTGADALSRDCMSEEERTQYNWMLDSIYDDLVSTISQGRNLLIEDVQSLIDQAPLLPDRAKEVGLVDEVLYEDELPGLLGENDESPATLKPYDKIASLMRRYVQRRQRQSIGVLSLKGAIMPGSSRSYPIPLPIFGSNTIGSSTVQQQIRAARQDPRIAAVVLHVDSPGGSALASDLIWRELTLLDEEKPLVVYMGNTAASGGYYIATPGRKIVAQNATLTGSIGVFTAKPVNEGTYAKIGANREIIQRGGNAGLYSIATAWNEQERASIENSIHHVYANFKQRVADGRGLEYETLDEICHGRVWTGLQAQQNGLVDELGDFHVAINLACELAELPTDGSTRVRNLPPSKETHLAESVSKSDEMQRLSSLREWIHLMSNALQGDWESILNGERYWLMADGLPTVRG